MRLSLFPKEEKFFELFEQQGKIIAAAARSLAELFEHYERLPELVAQIEDLEHQGDKVVREVSIRLSKIFVTPIDREDIHELCSVLDDVIDYIRAASMRLVLFDVKAPTPSAIELSRTILNASLEINEALATLENFQNITQHTNKIREYEKVGDQINRTAMGSLFHDGSPVIEIIKWQEIYDRLETAIDKCEDVAKILDGIVLKHS